MTRCFTPEQVRFMMAQACPHCSSVVPCNCFAVHIETEARDSAEKHERTYYLTQEYRL